MKKILISSEILKMYKEGVRNFEGIKITAQDFNGVDLSGASFKKSDLSWSSFDNSTLVGADFTEANLTWTAFRRANLRNANFIKADVSYSDFSGATFDKTNFTNANLTASLFFNVNMGAAKLNGANLAWSATSITQLTEDGLRFAIEKLKQIGMRIPPELLAKLEVQVKQLHEKQKLLAELKPAYLTRVKGKEREELYSVKAKLESEIQLLYSSIQTVYNQAVEYSTREAGGKRHVSEYKK
jgi:hypothetical protein